MANRLTTGAAAPRAPEAVEQLDNSAEEPQRPTNPRSFKADAGASWRGPPESGRT
jgi:hypothetical protein